MRILVMVAVPLLLFCGTAVSQQVTNISRTDLLDSAKAFESKHDYRSAVQIYRTLFLNNPPDLEAGTFLARDLSWNGMLDSSLAVYKEVLAMDHGYFDALVGYATVLSWKGDYAGSLAEMDGLLDRYPRDPHLLVLAARVSLWAGQFGRSVGYARHSLEVDSTDTDALLILAQAYDKQLDLDSANISVNRLLLLEPGNVVAGKLRAALRDEFRNKTDLNYYSENFGPENVYSNSIITLSFARRVSYHVTLSAAIASRDIFGSRDVAGTVGAAFRLSDAFVVNGEFLYGPGTSTAQRERGTVELTYAVLTPLSVSGSFQYLRFAGASVRVVSPSLEYYFSPECMFLLRGYFGSTTDRGSSASILARFNLPVSDDFQISLSGSHGAELYRLVSQSYLSVIATGGSVGASFSFTRALAAELNLNYTKWKSSPWKYSFGGSINLAYQW